MIIKDVGLATAKRRKGNEDDEEGEEKSSRIKKRHERTKQRKEQTSTMIQMYNNGRPKNERDRMNNISISIKTT